jgi:excisionase family DNA binding protein
MQDFLRVEDLAGMLKISRVFVYKMVREKRIPFYRIDGKCVRFASGEIQTWLEERRGKEYHRDKN